MDIFVPASSRNHAGCSNVSQHFLLPKYLRKLYYLCCFLGNTRVLWNNWEWEYQRRFKKLQYQAAQSFIPVQSLLWHLPVWISLLLMQSRHTWVFCLMLLRLTVRICVSVPHNLEQGSHFDQTSPCARISQTRVQDLQIDWTRVF